VKLVYGESVDAIFRSISDQVRKAVFQPENNPGSHSNTLRTPPLASLLPQMKVISTRLLPEDLDDDSIELKHILSSGPLLDSFCLSLFDAEETSFSAISY
jgi:hypothetical protein